jgi:hypothetical protein
MLGRKLPYDGKKVANYMEEGCNTMERRFQKARKKVANTGEKVAKYWGKGCNTMERRLQNAEVKVAR